MIRKTKCPYLRDLYLAFLIEDAKCTKADEFPIIETWMVSKTLPKDVIQWDRKKDTVDCKNTAICFYCNDIGFNPILNNPKKYLDELKKYQMIIGLDASPYDNMPLVVQKSQIYLNLAVTYYYGKHGIKIIPNVRLGDNRTLTALEAFPKHTLIAIGTNGFVKLKNNRDIFSYQLTKIIEFLEPTGIIVYGPAPEFLFKKVKENNIPIYVYKSYSMKENARIKHEQMSKKEGLSYER